MSENTIGTLVVALQANVARLQQDLGRATSVVESGSREIARAASMAQTALGALGIGLSAGAFAVFVKGAIDSADALNDLSARIGVSVRDLAGWKLAAEQSGASLEAIGKGMKSLSGYMVEHSDKLEKLGVSTTNSKKAFTDLADVFAKLPDGYVKTALATQLFGKAGMELIPMLNMGAAGLEEAQAKSAKFAERMAAMAPLADQFNDQMAEMKIASGGLGAIIGMSLTPILVELANEMLEAQKANAEFGFSFDPLGEAVKAAIVLFGNVGFVLKGVGTEIGGVSAQIAALASGDFSAFSAIGKMMKEDAERARKEFDAWEQKIMGLKTGVAALKAAPAAKPESSSGDMEGKVRSILADNQATKAKDEFAKAMEAVNAAKMRSIGLDPAYFANLKALYDGYQHGRIKLDQYRAAVSALTSAQQFSKDIDKEAADEAKRWQDMLEKAIKTEADGYEAAIKLAEAKQLQNEEIGLTAEALEELRLKRLDDTIAQEEQRLAGMKLGEVSQAEIAYLQARIDKLKELRTLTSDGITKTAAAEEAKKAAEEWKKTSETIERSLTDALVRGFEGGKSVAQNFRDTLANMFKTLVLRPFIQPVMGSVAGGMMSAFSGQAGASGMGSMGGMGGDSSMSLLQAGKTMWDGFSGGMSAGMGSLVTGFGDMIGSSAVSTFGTGMGLTGAEAAAAAEAYSAAGMASTGSALTAGSAVGMAIPYVAIAYAIYSIMESMGAFGSDEVQTGAGVTMSVRGKSAQGSSWASYHTDGGWFGDDNDRKDGAPLSAQSMNSINATLSGVYDVVRGFSEQLGDPAILRRLDDFSASYNGAAEGLESWLKFTVEAMLTTALPGVAQFKRDGEEVQATIQRLAQAMQTIEGLSSAIDGQIGLMSGDVTQYAQDLAAANGAIEKLYQTLAGTSDIQTRVELEGQLYQAVNARYQLESKYLGEIAGMVTQSLQSVREARAAVGGSISGIVGGPGKTAADLRAGIAGSVTGLALPSMQGVIDTNLAAQKATEEFRAESARVAESNREIKRFIGAIDVGGWALNGGEQVGEYNTLVDMASKAGILAGSNLNSVNYRNSNAVVSLKDGYRFTVDGAGIGQSADITHSQDWVDVNGIGWSRFNRSLGMEYFKPQGHQTVSAGIADAVKRTTDAYQKAQDEFAAAMKAFTGDAARATQKLQGLREETVKYYEAQKQLAELLSQSASALGQTIASLTLANQTPVNQVGTLKAKFDALYSGADGLSGAELASRANDLNALAPSLMEAARQSYASGPEYQLLLSGVTAALADLQTRLNGGAPRDYEAESLSLLSGIDAALGYIETNLASADQQIVEAINASKDSTVAVLKDIRALLGGEKSTITGLPGHADGLSWVPYDNYSARLHRGEAVIDAQMMDGLRRYGIPVAPSSGGADLSRLEAAVREGNALLERLGAAVSRQTAELAGATRETAREIGYTLAGASDAMRLT